jgi:vesicle coat complex subunit
MSYISVPAVHRALLDPLRHALKDADPYVRKTAAICVAKLFTHDRKLVEKEQFINSLRDLLADSNPTVIANAVAALTEISEKSENIQLRLNLVIANKLLSALNECSELVYTLASSISPIIAKNQERQTKQTLLCCVKLID